jgi:flavodoxin
MKKIGLALLILVIAGVCTFAWSRANSPMTEENKKTAAVQPTSMQTTEKAQVLKTNGKILVVYYSLSGNTKEVANLIHEEVGGDVFEIQTKQTYPTEHDPLIAQAKQELTDGYQPELKTKLDHINTYDVIFIGSPVWWGTFAPAVSTFLSQYDLSGKTIIPFCTHASNGGEGSSFRDMAARTPNSSHLEGLSIVGTNAKNTRQDVNAWLRRIHILQ